MEEFSYILELTKVYGYWVVGIGIFLECMGVPFPGETVLILGAVSASLGYMNLTFVIILAAMAAIIGDNIGYYLGKKYGRKIIKKFEHFPLFHYKHIDRAERFFKAHGNKTVFIGRFTAILRTYAALFAGVFDMPYGTFFFYNFTGGVIWATVMGLVGFHIGNNLELIGQIITDFNLVFLAIAVGFVVYKVARILHRKHIASRPKKL
jgi:membrane protein DedA with SNARE-associated domain